ncbi:MAG: CaiB/BaiF CoA transferase family protein [Maritimibacter sp.]
MSGPLSDVKIIEFAAQGPAPFAGSLLADFGADVVVIDRPAAQGWQPDTPRGFDFYMRNKRSIGLDLKSAEGQAEAQALIAKADVVIEGYRPGVIERLGFAPERCFDTNPALVFARMTGWGQEGPLAQEAGHDINYLALTGALAAIGTEGAPPPPPLNLVADLGGGAMFLVMGILMALHEARRSGQGQVVDCAMIDGVAQLMSAFQAFRQQGTWSDKRQDNIVDGGAPQFATYETADGKYVAIGAIEPKFWSNLLAVLELDEARIPSRDDRANWPVLRAELSRCFAQKTRAEWRALMAGKDTCFAPVLTMDEAWDDPQMVARGTFEEMGGLRYPAPAPRLSRTPGRHSNPAPEPGANDADVRGDWLGGNQ